MNIPNQLIDNIGLSVRTANVLKKAGIFTVTDLLNTSRLQLSASKTPGMGKYTIDEAMNKADELRSDFDNGDLFETSKTFDTHSLVTGDFLEWITTPDGKKVVNDWLDNKKIRISALPGLSARAYNILFLNNYVMLQQIVFMGEDELLRIPRMGKKDALEIIKTSGDYLEKNKDSILSNLPRKESGEKIVTLHKLLQYPNHRDQVITFIEKNDKDLLQIGISQKACRKLQINGIYKLSELFSLPWDELQTMDMISEKHAEEIIRHINAYLKTNGSRLIAFCNGDESVLFDDEALRIKIMNAYSDSPFRGYSINEFAEELKLSNDSQLEKLKRIIGKLISDGWLEYVDFRCYRIYKSFPEIMENCSDLDEWKKDIVRLRLSGLTLEEIGKQTVRTRESVRQTINSALKSIKNRLIAETGCEIFDEDYYKYFYKTYNCKQADAEKWLGISAETWYYLEMVSPSHGKKNLEDAIDDYHNLDLGLRLKIKNLVNQEKLFIDGVWIKKKRESLERYVIQHFCRNEVSIQEFMERFNSFLEREEVQPDEDIWLDQNNIKSRKNAISKSNYALWSYNERFRYYDVDGRDFTELIDTIDLDSYENTEISTLKFMNDYPDIMHRYDIRNQYELHNLLKKIIPDGSYNQFHCGRMPIIEFGSFNRTNAIEDLIINNSPLPQDELLALVYDEYGFETGAIPWRDIVKYKTGDIYRVENKVMPHQNMDILKSSLTEDFYYIDEIKHIYSSLFPDRDTGEVNSYNLSVMGFVVYPNYAVQNYNTVDSYFQDILTREDIVDLYPLRKRFTAKTFFCTKLQKLKQSLEIIEFEPNKVINIRKLLNNGVSRMDLENFCDDVYEFVSDESYFSVESLRKAGFTSALFDLGFSDWFYANLLAMDDRFAYNRMFSNIILYKGEEDITIKSFGSSIIQKYGSIDVFDLMDVLTNEYGCHPNDRHDVLYKVQGEGIYYDSILDRLYANEEIYYRELESMEKE